MSDLLNPTAERQPERKSASHGEAGYKRADRDWYPTEPWVTRALIGAVEEDQEVVDLISRNIKALIRTRASQKAWRTRKRLQAALGFAGDQK